MQIKNYVINLERAIERRKASLDDFIRNDIDFEFVSGIDWQDISDQDIRTHVQPKYLYNVQRSSRPLVHGTLACWLSHRKVWQMALDNREDIIAVFEDDCRLTNATKPALMAIDKIRGGVVSTLISSFFTMEKSKNQSYLSIKSMSSLSSVFPSMIQ